MNNYEKEFVELIGILIKLNSVCCALQVTSTAMLN